MGIVLLRYWGIISVLRMKMMSYKELTHFLSRCLDINALLMRMLCRQLVLGLI